MADTDPLTQVYNKTVFLVKNTNATRALLKDINIIDWAAKKSPVKDALTKADLPEFQIKASGLQTAPGITSSHTELQFTIALELLSNDRNIKTRYLPLCFALSAIAQRIRSGSEFRNMTWEGQKFFRDATFSVGQQGQADPTTSRGAQGWSMLWSFIAYIDLPNAQLETFLDA